METIVSMAQIRGIPIGKDLYVQLNDFTESLPLSCIRILKYWAIGAFTVCFFALFIYYLDMLFAVRPPLSE